jgi:predicted HicB family RNase H-like nuclease
VNQAIQLLKRETAPAEVVTRLAARLGVSARQAARYVRAAQQQPGPLAIPEVREVFTVKLPKSLIHQVRRTARLQESSISEWVAEALEEQLRGRTRHG